MTQKIKLARQEKAAAIFAVWLILKPLLSMMLQVFWLKQRDIQWLPLLLPAIYLGAIGGALHAIIYYFMNSKLSISITYNAFIGLLAAIIATSFTFQVHDQAWLLPPQTDRLFLFCYLSVLSVLFSAFVYSSIIKTGKEQP